MPMISEEDQKFLTDYFAKEMANPVKVEYFTQKESKLVVPGVVECMYCRETRELLQELDALSDKIELSIHDLLGDPDAAAAEGVEKIPAIVVKGQNKGKVRFFGIPSGYEFATLVETIAEAGRGTTDLSDATKKALDGLQKEIHIQVFTTPT